MEVGEEEKNRLFLIENLLVSILVVMEVGEEVYKRIDIIYVKKVFQSLL